MGFSISFLAIMLPIVLVLERYSPGITNELTLDFIKEIIVIVPAIIICGLIMSMIRKKVIRGYLVQIQDDSVIFWEDGREKKVGKINRILIKERAGFYQLKVWGNINKETFIVRRRGILFGDGRAEDFVQIKKLAQDLKQYPEGAGK